jgi:hypothetical protein
MHALQKNENVYERRRPRLKLGDGARSSFFLSFFLFSCSRLWKQNPLSFYYIRDDICLFLSYLGGIVRQTGKSATSGYSVTPFEDGTNGKVKIRTFDRLFMDVYVALVVLVRYVSRK